MKIEFFHQMKKPPRATSQQRRHTLAGKTYQPANVQLARATLQAIFEQYAPAKPMGGAVALSLTWTFYREGADPVPKTTRPDCDNLAKIAIDAMTAAGWWLDDSQVYRMELSKHWGDMPGIAVCATDEETDHE